ncbi:MAG: hypothetical protein JNK73_00290 [Bacteroidia bacterium]|nr:hypothetical protein [Bacteroidia bacterium]
MKKSLTLLALVLGMSGAFAQDLTSKKGEPFLPEAGDWGLGIDANPFLEYAGNFFGKTTTNPAPTFNFLTPFQITGRYFKDATTAYRGSLRIGFGTITERNMVTDRLAAYTNTTNTFPTNPAEVENVWKSSGTNIGISGGLEMRRGKTRLQGYYGGELGISFSTTSDKFEYGNALNTSTTTLVDVDPTDDAFSGSGNIIPNLSVGNAPAADARVITRKNGSTFGIGLRGFVGVEYFLFPKISLGGEFGWGFMLISTGKTKTTVESMTTNASGNLVTGETELEGAKSGEWSLDTDNNNSVWGPAGTLRLNFYF